MSENNQIMTIYKYELTKGYNNDTKKYYYYDKIDEDIYKKVSGVICKCKKNNNTFYTYKSFINHITRDIHKRWVKKENDNINKDIDTDIIHLKTELKEKNIIITRLSNKLSNLEIIINELKQECNEYKKNETNLKATIKEMEEKCNYMRTECNQTIRDKNTAEYHLNLLNMKYQELKEQYEESQIIIKHNREDMNTITNERDDLKEQLNKLKIERTGYKKNEKKKLNLLIQSKKVNQTTPLEELD